MDETVKTDMKKTTAEPVDFVKITPDANNEKPRRKYKKRTKKTDATIRPKTEKLFELLNEILPKRLGDEWKLEPGEVTALGTVTDDLVEKYSNQFLNKYAEEVAFISVAGSIIVPRLLYGKPKPEPFKPEV